MNEYRSHIFLDAVWITWENQRRNRELSRALNIHLEEWAYLDSIANPIKKYVLGASKTVLFILKRRPRIIIAQNPSIVLSMMVIIMSLFRNSISVIDAHNAGLFPMEGKSALLMRVSRFIQRYAALTFVSNPGLQPIVESNGGRAFILPDPFPHFPKDISKIDLGHDFNVLFICSYAADEPYEAVFEAAKKIPANIHIWVTGNYKKKAIEPSQVSENITLMGFISDEKFVQMLFSVDATIDLTTRENCLVCGAYESVSAGKPMIISNTHALRSYFDEGAVYTDHSPEQLVAAINRMVAQHSDLRQGIINLKRTRQREWKNQQDRLIKRLSVAT